MATRRLINKHPLFPLDKVTVIVAVLVTTAIMCISPSFALRCVLLIPLMSPQTLLVLFIPIETSDTLHSTTVLMVRTSEEQRKVVNDLYAGCHTCPW